MKNLQTAESLQDFIEMGAKVTNAIDAQVITQTAAKFSGNNTTEWKREFFSRNFYRFSKCQVYKILMGELAPDHRQYHYVPIPF